MTSEARSEASRRLADPDSGQAIVGPITAFEMGAQWGEDQALETAATMAEREGHSWSGAPATAFFQLADRLRRTSSSDRGAS